jgi:hypothetical protein
MSVPAAKALSPAPRSTSARTAPSVGGGLADLGQPAYMPKVRALRACGRLKVMMPMPSRTS